MLKGAGSLLETELHQVAFSVIIVTSLSIRFYYFGFKLVILATYGENEVIESLRCERRSLHVSAFVLLRECHSLQTYFNLNHFFLTISLDTVLSSILSSPGYLVSGQSVSHTPSTGTSGNRASWPR